MIKLNLPDYRLRLRKEEGKTYIYDDLRQRFVTLTPEEWVRQHFVHYLMEHLGYPRELMMNEVTIQVGLTTKRCDTLLYSRQLTPRVLIEYKAPHIRITDRVLQQILRYNYTLRVPYLILSNGLEHFACRLDYEQGSYTFLEHVAAGGAVAGGAAPRGARGRGGAEKPTYTTSGAMASTTNSSRQGSSQELA